VHCCYPILLELTTFHLPATFKQQQTCAMLFKMSSVLKFKTSHKNLLKKLLFEINTLFNQFSIVWVDNLYAKSRVGSTIQLYLSDFYVRLCALFKTSHGEREKKHCHNCLLLWSVSDKYWLFGSQRSNKMCNSLTYCK